MPALLGVVGAAGSGVGHLEGYVRCREGLLCPDDPLAVVASGCVGSPEAAPTPDPFVGLADRSRQAFTEGERWKVQPARANRLLGSNLITSEQYEHFVKDGAIGSHLENLQRHGGFKGFNQKSVSVVISATDPRKNMIRTEPIAA